MIIRSYYGLEAGESLDRNSILGKASCQIPIGQAAAEVEKGASLLGAVEATQVQGE